MKQDRLVLWIAQGFGIGRIPFAPGTFGTILGFAWFGLLLWPGNSMFFAGGTLAGIWVSIWSSGRAEKILGTTDPSSVVIDEIIAVPCCFLGWFIAIGQHVAQPPFWMCGLVFVSFRFFDILKPWPIKQSQSLHGGWGVTVDDCLAAGYVNLVTLAALRVWR